MNPTPSLDPKGEAGAKKTPLQLLPPYALAQTALAHAEGARRYGPWNWRTNQVCATTYIGAILRHLTAWQDGEDIDADSGLSHIAKIGACCNILLDAGHCGTLVDDRSKVPTKTNPNYTDAPFSEIRGFLKDGKFTVVQIGGPDSGFEQHGTPAEPASGWGSVELEPWMSKPPTNLREDIQRAINCRSAENGSDTPDWILAEYLIGCLETFDKAVTAREAWYDRSKVPVEPMEPFVLIPEDLYPIQGESSGARVLNEAASKIQFNPLGPTITQIGGPDSGFEQHGTPVEPHGIGKVMAEIEAAVTPSHPPTPCCNYRAELSNTYPVFWNPFNKVVQCHNCGHQYEAVK